MHAGEEDLGTKVTGDAVNIRIPRA